MNCSIDLISRPMIKFSKEPVCRDNFEICKKFLLVYDKLLQENLAK
jgi:hypothetical protein